MDWRGSAWIVVALGCGPAVVLPPEGDDESSSGTTGASVPSTSTPGTSMPGTSTSTPPDPVTGVDVTTGSSATVGSTSSDSTGCDGDDGERPDECGPAPDSVGYQVRVDPEPKRNDGDELDVDAPCSVIAVEGEASEVTITLACDEAAGSVEHVVEVGSDPAIDLGLEIGGQVHLRAVRNYPIDYGGYAFVVLRDAGGDIIAAAFEPYLDNVPAEVGDVAAFYAPIGFSAVDMGCDPVPYEDPNCGGGFIEDPCPSEDTRLAVEFTAGDDTVLLWSLTAGDLGPFRVRAYAIFLGPVPQHECVIADLPVTLVWWTALRPAP